MLRRSSTGLIAAVAFALGVFTGAATAQQPPALKPLTVLVGPLASLDPIWMADTQGYFKKHGLDVTLKLFPSGTTALQVFKTGVGDIVFSGELPGVSYWKNSGGRYRIIAVDNRESNGYQVTAAKTIASAADLRGKTVATRVGSTGSWFIAEYLAKNGLAPGDVKVRDLDTQVMPAALCRGDIDAFFIWHPFGARALDICGDKVHRLSTAEGYIHGYGMLGARPEWLADKDNAETAVRFLRAFLEGRDYAKGHFDEVAAYTKAKFGLDVELTRFSWSTIDRYPGFDQVFFDDFCRLSAWMRAQGLLSDPIQFDALVWSAGLTAIDRAWDTLPARACPS